MKIDRYYQWLPNTGNDGEIVKLKNIYYDNDIVFYEFSDGEICNEEFIAPYTTSLKDIKGKMLVELSSRNDSWQQDYIKSKAISDPNIQSENGRQREIPPLDDILKSSNDTIEDSAIGKYRLIPPKSNKTIQPIDYKDYMSNDDLIKMGLIEAPKDVVKEKEEKVTTNHIEDEIIETDIIKYEKDDINNQEDSVVETTKKQEETTNPIAILVNASAKNPITIPMELTIDLPSKDLFNIIKNNFEDGSEKFIDVILSHIDYDMLVSSLKEALTNAYNE